MRSRSRLPGLGALALVVSLLVALTPSTSGAVAARPDLVVTVVAAKATSVTVGKRLPVRLVTKNRGRRKARASTTRLYLSRTAGRTARTCERHR